MRNLLSIITVLTFLFISVNSFAQTSTDPWTKFNAEKKSELTAGILEWLIPVVGHAYAEDAGRGLIPAGVSVGGLVLIFASGGETGLVTVGLLGYLIGRVWGIVSAVETASDFNNNLKSKLNLTLKPMKFPNNNFGYAISISLAYN
ncbi:MAG: hypothetical protein FJW56_05300 [Actinobacteria bacterium]|nr:hypothetical protein [Actinomycetota bacterium]